MRKLSLEDYTVHVLMPDGAMESKPYQVRESLITVLFNPMLKLKAVDVLKRDIFGKALLGCKDDEILIEEADYKMLKNSVETVEGFTQHDVELIKKVMDAPEVEVKENG